MSPTGTRRWNPTSSSLMRSCGGSTNTSRTRRSRRKPLRQRRETERRPDQGSRLEEQWCRTFQDGREHGSPCAAAAAHWGASLRADPFHRRRSSLSHPTDVQPDGAAALLVGYGYAHLVSTRLSLRRQVLLHAAVLLVPLASLPIAAAGRNPPASGSPIPSLMGLLAVSVGLPFCVVSTTSPLLQHWFSKTPHPSAADPYFLYGASNVGSLTGLIAYPVLLEPTLPLHAHGLIWTGGYFLLIALVLVCGTTMLRAVRRDAAPTAEP